MLAKRGRTICKSYGSRRYSLGDTTVAVKVTAWPLSDEFKEKRREVEVVSFVLLSNIEALLLFPLRGV